MSSEEAVKFLAELEELLLDRKNKMPEGSYTTRLYHKGLDKILQKVGEESIEYIIDAKNRNKERAISEASDLFYHLLVSFIEIDISLTDIA